MIDEEHPLLTALTGQWGEAVDPAPHPVLVTSRAAVLHGDLRGASGTPTRGVALPDGAGLAAAEDGRIGVRPGDPAPRFTTPEAVAA